MKKLSQMTKIEKYITVCNAFMLADMLLLIPAYVKLISLIINLIHKFDSVDLLFTEIYAVFVLGVTGCFVVYIIDLVKRAKNGIL